MTAQSEELKKELKRRGTLRVRMLNAFKREGELTTTDLLRFGPGLSSRLYELRQDGHKIAAVKQHGTPLYRYIYLGKSEEDEPAVGTTD